MQVITDNSGKVVGRSKNLRGIRAAVSRDPVECVELLDLGWSAARLSITFKNGNRFTTEFASYSILLLFVRSWRNLYGVRLSIGGLSRGVVAYNNPALSRPV